MMRWRRSVMMALVYFRRRFGAASIAAIGFSMCPAVMFDFELSAILLATLPGRQGAFNLQNRSGSNAARLLTKPQAYTRWDIACPMFSVQTWDGICLGR